MRYGRWKTAAAAVAATIPVATALLAVMLLPAGAAGQSGARALDGGGEVRFRSDVMERSAVTDRPLVDTDQPYVVVHLADNRVYVFQGSHSVWSAPAGTGTGFRLDRGKHAWKFSTPRGLFRIQRMEKDPLWEAPDWHYVERGLPIPPQNSPARLMHGVMGTTALYLGDGIAIHGTNAPQLVLNPDPARRRVSHGCIRLTNEAARDLMHMVHVGTLVLVY